MDSKANQVPFFGVVASHQSYVNILYLLLSFPLGIFYFVFLTTALSLGVGLIPIFVGIPLLAFVFYLSRSMMGFERVMAENILNCKMSQPAPRLSTSVGFWAWIKNQVFDLQAWKSLIYLFIKFPMGILSFVATVTLSATSIALTLTPLVYGLIRENISIDIFDPSYSSVFSLLPVEMSSFDKAVLGSLVGVALGIVSLHIFNLLAWFNARLVAVMSKEW
jgi:hypothetical protein